LALLGWVWVLAFQVASGCQLFLPHQHQPDFQHKQVTYFFLAGKFIAPSIMDNLLV